MLPGKFQTNEIPFKVSAINFTIIFLQHQEFFTHQAFFAHQAFFEHQKYNKTEIFAVGD